MNFYIEDLCGLVFGDFDSTDAETQASCGVELHLETHVAFVVPVDMGARLVMNKEEKLGVDLLLRVNTLVF